jgi:phage-related protein
MPDSFLPPVPPADGGARRTTNVRLNEAKFGDGYSQRSLDGLNAVERTLALTWPPLTQAQADAIESFLDDHAGQAFFYALPGDAAPRLWICRQWEMSHREGDSWTLSATLEEVFDLV